MLSHVDARLFSIFNFEELSRVFFINELEPCRLTNIHKFAKEMQVFCRQARSLRKPIVFKLENSNKDRLTNFVMLLGAVLILNEKMKPTELLARDYFAQKNKDLLYRKMTYLKSYLRVP